MQDIQGKHNAILENRSRLMLTGVTDVDSFDEHEIFLFTELGALMIRGNALHVNEMSVGSGEITVEGEFSALIYTEKGKRKKLFKGKL